MKTIRVGLIGYGTIGKGVFDIVEKQRNFFKSAFGLDIKVSAIAEKNPEVIKNIPTNNVFVTQNSDEIINNQDINIVVELIGGITIAKDIIIKSIKAGKHIVTANKHLIAKFGHEIFPLAQENKSDVYFEASVGGGIPVIKALRESLTANDIIKIQCIINGTTNYILSRIHDEGLSFKEVLKDAQEKGFAEADPTFDVDGIDAMHKVAILTELAYGHKISVENIYTEGIRDITPEDVAYADELGYTIKLLGIIQKQDKNVDARVHPVLLPKSHPLANVNDVFNGVLIKGDFVDSVLLTGKGAGRYPTASAVVSDIVDISRNIVSNSPNRTPMNFFSDDKIMDVVSINDIYCRYYLRFTVTDKEGVMAKLSSNLEKKQISIASIMQKENKIETEASIIILTHKTKEQFLQEAIKEINNLDIVKKTTQVIRIEEEEKQ